MATDGPTPPKAPDEFFNKGTQLCVLIGSSNAIERWVRSVAERAQSRLDWGYFAGRAVVMHLGDKESFHRSAKIAAKLIDTLDGHLFSRLPGAENE